MLYIIHFCWLVINTFWRVYHAKCSSDTHSLYVGLLTYSYSGLLIYIAPVNWVVILTGIFLFFNVMTNILYHSKCKWLHEIKANEPSFLTRLFFSVAFGGIAGLCLGFSLLSGAELFYYLTFRLYWQYRLMHQKRSTPKHKYNVPRKKPSFGIRQHRNSIKSLSFQNLRWTLGVQWVWNTTDEEQHPLQYDIKSS